MCGLLLLAAASQDANHFSAPATSHAPSPSESPSNFNHLVDIAPIQVRGQTDGTLTMRSASLRSRRSRTERAGIKQPIPM